MKQQVVTQGVVLARTNFGEADRIITMITPDHGKVRLIAKGVRKMKSKLAGGIELFSVSQITFMPGRGDISTLLSTRLVKHYGNLVTNLARTNAGYDLLKTTNKATQDECEAEYFEILTAGLDGLNNLAHQPELAEAWFQAQILRQLGNEPNLQTDAQGKKLQEAALYDFDYENMLFVDSSNGSWQAKDIKLFRLLLSQPLSVLMTVQGSDEVAAKLLPFLKPMLAEHIR